MTVSTTKASDVFPGNGVATGFDCEWRIFDDTDVLVSLVDQETGADTPLVLNTDYTISGAGDQAGFTIATMSPVATGTSLYARRALPFTQPTDFTNQGAFFPTMHEDAMDRLEMQIQQQSDDIGRSLKSNAVTGNFNLGGKKIAGSAVATDGADVPSLEQVQTLVASAASGIAPDLIVTLPNLASTAPGKGASLIGFLQSGTGAVSRTAQDKTREWVSVKDFGAAGDGIADDTVAIQAAITYAETVGGCVVRVPFGTYKITDTLLIGATGARSAILAGDGPGNESGGGGSSAATVIQWWGATAGGTIMVKQSGLTCWGMSNLALDGRYRPGATDTTNKPDYALVLDRTQFSRFENVRLTGWLRCGLYIQPITSAANDNCSFNQFINLSIAGYNPSGIAIELHGNASTFGGTELHTSNVCHNTFVQTHIVHAKYGLDIFDADNNSFLMTRIFPRPEATTAPPYGVVLEGSYARSIYFFHLQSGGDMLCKTGSAAVIYGYDRENGSNAPTVQSGAKVKWDSFGNNALGEFNHSYYNQVAALVAGDPVLSNSGSAEPSLFTILRGSNGARLCVGVVNSPRSVNIYAHGSAPPSAPAIQFGNDTINTFLLGSRQITSGTAAPTTGAWSRGDMVFNQLPSASGNIGWVCVSSGAPGTWKTWGTIGA